MAKKFLAGVALGSLAGLAAWKSLDEKQQAHIKAKVKDSVYTAMDVVTDYTLDALDIADTMIHDYGVSAAEKMDNFSNVVKDKKDSVSNHFVSDNFDQETADLRDALQQEHDNDDIVIDKTKNTESSTK